MNPDFVDLLRAFIAAEVRFLIVGAYALAIHGRPRATGDLDLWVEATPANAGRVMRALAAFGAPVSDIAEADFATPGVTYQIGARQVGPRISATSKASNRDAAYRYDCSR